MDNIPRNIFFLLLVTCCQTLRQSQTGRNLFGAGGGQVPTQVLAVWKTRYTIGKLELELEKESKRYEDSKTLQIPMIPPSFVRGFLQV
jgi:hypothetical protein